ncbi:unnamed protein product [Mytilus edulis]|uniref:Uncharacterized protein n=1 Tax=Mytilus edulis TaxID=6550 RepID=A0A8S3TFY9_MYTED|nr:unnamed protein product [Mytilus edulis]
MKYIFQIFLVFIFSKLNLGASLNITIISDTQYDDALTNCTSEFSGSLIPLKTLQSNASLVLETLEVNETAWTGQEKFVIGCQNETGICTDIIHERVPTSFKLNYTCVTNDIAVMTSNEVKSTTIVCGTANHPAAQFPNLMVITNYIDFQKVFRFLKGVQSGLIRRCQFVRKTDECSLRLEFGHCDDTRQGICYTAEKMLYQSSLKFVDFKETDNITARERIDISEDELCYVSTVTPIKETTENMPPSTQEYTTSTTRPEPFSDNPSDETSASGPDVPAVPAEPAEPRKPSPEESNNLWIIAVVIVSLLVIMIIIFVMIWRHKRRQRGTILEHDGEKRASTSDVSGPVTGSLRRYQTTSSRPYGTDSGIEVLGRGMFSGLQSENIEITDLDEDIEETKLNDNGTLREVNVMSVNNENYNITTEIKEDKIKETEAETKSTSSNNDVVNESDDKTALILDKGELSELTVMIENTENQKDKIQEVEAETKSTSSSNDAINADSSDDKSGLIIEDP